MLNPKNDDAYGLREILHGTYRMNAQDLLCRAAEEHTGRIDTEWHRGTTVPMIPKITKNRQTSKFLPFFSFLFSYY